MIAKSMTMKVVHESDDRTIDSLINCLHQLRNEVPGGDAEIEIALYQRHEPRPGALAIPRSIPNFQVTASWTKELKDA